MKDRKSVEHGRQKLPCRVVLSDGSYGQGFLEEDRGNREIEESIKEEYWETKVLSCKTRKKSFIRFEGTTEGRHRKRIVFTIRLYLGSGTEGVRTRTCRLPVTSFSV